MAQRRNIVINAYTNKQIYGFNEKLYDDVKYILQIGIQNNVNL